MNHKQNPFDAINTIAPIFTNIMNDVFNHVNNVQDKQNDVAYKIPATNITEHDHGYEMHVALPGFSKEEISMKIEEENLIITATKASSNENSNSKFIKKEIDFSNCKRVFLLSSKIDKSKINASFNNGILIVSLPKKESISFNINVE